ncbi:unnamed protein product [Meganyctiphanes norvegica]|uniref:PDZ domain-containing protein n=1 Tax=Meganyctiphanes norvegica TaxID=48144 RepID=A0AAV2RPY7_MEGNR
MSLYPSLEDMKVDQMGRAQVAMANEVMASQHAAAAQIQQAQYPSAPSAYPTMAPSAPVPYALTPPQLSQMYPELNDFMGLEFTQDVIAANMPEYLPNNQNAVAIPAPTSVAVPGSVSGLPAGMVAPISGNSVGLHRAAVTGGVRQITLCKDAEGKVGMRVKAINKGIFICLVKQNSPAALGGLRFGDQILQINGATVAGYSMEKVHDILKKCSTNGIELAIRDRPFERTVTLHKDSSGHIGFQFSHGEITALVKDSSAARNGLLTEHHLLEVNGQNVVGLKDKEVTAIINECGQVVTVTVMPAFVYKHMLKHMASSLVTKFMDHSIPDM